MKNILFLVEHNAHFRAPLLLIKKLKRDEKFNPIVYFNVVKGYNFGKEISICKEYNIEFISDKVFLENTEVSESNSKLEQSSEETNINVLLRLKRFLIDEFLFVFLYRVFTKLINESTQLLKKHKVAILISPEDNVPSISCFVRAAKKLNIPSVVIPFTLSNENEFLTSHKLYLVNTLFKKMFCWFFPKWMGTYNGKYYITKTLDEAAVMELLNISPEQPWITMGGRSDYLLAESSYVENYYKSSKIRASKIKRTGLVYQDILFDKMSNYQQLRLDLIKQYSLDPNKPIMLCGLHPVYENYDLKFASTGLFGTNTVGGTIKEFDFKTVGEMTDFWVKAMADCKNYQVIIHNHPRTILEKVKYIESFGVTIVEGDITDFLPFCDIYVSAVSATIRMAVACGKPVVCYTMGYYYSDYDNFSAVFKVSTRKEYKEILEKITTDHTFYSEASNHQKALMKEFSFGDNLSGERIIDFFESITQDGF